MVTPEQRREYSRRWAKKNPEKVKAAKKRYTDKNKEKIAAYARERKRIQAEKVRLEQKAWANANPDLVAMARIRARLRAKHKAFEGSIRFHYGITAEQYAEIKAIQNDVCAICRTNEPTSRSSRLFVDHSHKTGALRGLLCHRCNSGLGYFKDSLSLIQRAIAYLEAFDGQPFEKDWVGRVRSVLESLPEASGEERRNEGMVKSFGGEQEASY